MRTRITNSASLARVAVVGLSLISSPFYGQQPKTAPAQTPPGSGGPGQPPTKPDPTTKQFRTVDGVRYVDGEAQPPNSQPSGYREVPNWPQLPAGRKLGMISAIGVGPDGNIWVADRCTTLPESCTDSDLAPIFEFSPSGKMLKNFGAGLFIYPHGLCVDKDGYVWVTDAR